MQEYNRIEDTQYISDAPSQLNKNMESIATDFSGASFPTENLFVGMKCLRTDENKIYRLYENASNQLVWQLEYTIVDGGIKVKQAEQATNDANGKDIATYIAKLEKDSNDDSIINIYNGANKKVGNITVATSMVGATSNSNGKAGNVPQPLAGDQDKVLHGDGSWRKAVGFESYWEPNEAVQAGEIRFPTGRNNSGIVLECVQTGTTGNTMPTIPNVVGMGLTTQDIQTLLTAIEQVQSTIGQTADKVTGISDYIIESYRNGTEWYEVYKSGKVRQGGQFTFDSDSERKTITFIKSFTNTDYYFDGFVVNSTAYPNSTLNLNGFGGSVYSKTSVSGLSIGRDAYNYGMSYISRGVVRWYAEGQGA